MRTISSTEKRQEDYRPRPLKTTENSQPKLISGFELMFDRGGYYLLKPSRAHSGSFIRHEVAYSTGYSLDLQRDDAPSMVLDD